MAPARQTRLRGRDQNALGRVEKEADWRRFLSLEPPGNSHCAPTLLEIERRGLAEYEAALISLDLDARELVELELIPRQRRHSRGSPACSFISRHNSCLRVPQRATFSPLHPTAIPIAPYSPPQPAIRPISTAPRRARTSGRRPRYWASVWPTRFLSRTRPRCACHRSSSA